MNRLKLFSNGSFSYFSSFYNNGGVVEAVNSNSYFFSNGSSFFNCNFFCGSFSSLLFVTASEE